MKNAELKALQSQINPHFLYNTLDLINWMADSGLNTDIKKVVKALARFYKVSLSSGKDIISLREELKHVSFYVQIQNIRFENKIDFQIHVPGELLDNAIPKITLQPIVENAILHGILGRTGREGTITIQGKFVNDNIHLIIRDDGVGMRSTHRRHHDGHEPQQNRGQRVRCQKCHRTHSPLFWRISQPHLS